MRGLAPSGVPLPRDDVSARIVVPIAVAAVALGTLLGLSVGAGGKSQPQRADFASRAAIGELSAARSAARRDLARATTPEAQGAAAEALRRAHLRAAHELGGADPSLAAALRAAAGAYAALGRAAAPGDREAYVRASNAVSGAEDRLANALRGPPS